MHHVSPVDLCLHTFAPMFVSRNTPTHLSVSIPGCLGPVPDQVLARRHPPGELAVGARSVEGWPFSEPQAWGPDGQDPLHPPPVFWGVADLMVPGAPGIPAVTAEVPPSISCPPSPGGVFGPAVGVVIPNPWFLSPFAQLSPPLLPPVALLLLVPRRVPRAPPGEHPFPEPPHSPPAQSTGQEWEVPGGGHPPGPTSRRRPSSSHSPGVEGCCWVKEKVREMSR